MPTYRVIKTPRGKTRATSISARRLHSSPRDLPAFFRLRESGGQGGRQQHGTERSNPWPGEARGRYVARACGLGCAHPVSQAHLACALFPISSVCNILNYDDGAPRRTLSFAPPHFPSAELHDGHLAALLDVGFKAHSTVLLWRMRWWLLLIHWSGVVRLTLPPCSLEAVAEVWRRRGLRPRGWVHPGAPSELRVAKGYTDTPVHIAPLDVGALALPPRAFQPKDLDELVPVCLRDSPASHYKITAIRAAVPNREPSVATRPLKPSTCIPQLWCISDSQIFILKFPLFHWLSLTGCATVPLCHFHSFFDVLAFCSHFLKASGISHLILWHSGQWYNLCLSVPSSSWHA